MRLSHDPLKISARFDDPNLVSRAGLVPVMGLAERAGMFALVRGHLRLAGACAANAGAKVGCLVAGMAAGAGSIDDMDVLRHGAMTAVFDGVRAPSTLGSFLRSFTWGNVLQLGKVSRELLAELAGRAGLLPGGDVLAFIDIDSTQRRVYGHAKQGAAFGHTKISGKTVLVRGLNALAATICTPQGAPVIAATWMRGGNANSARGTASLTIEAIGTARQAGCTGTVIVRADSAYYSAAFTAACTRAGAFFSVTARMDAPVRAAIAAIPEDGWTPIKYPRAVWDEQQGRWISDAQVAEARYTAFASVKGKATTARLIVRRVKDLNPRAGEGTSELFPLWRYHTVLTDSPFTMLQAEEQHRDHAVIEQVFADLTAGPLAHAPSGRVRRQRRLARAGRDRAQPDPRRRRPRLGPPCPGTRRHDPGRPDPRRRPDRAARPRPPHLAPARRMAPPGRMGEPVHRRVRSARPRGLTSPDPVTRCHGRWPRRPQDPRSPPGQAAGTVSGTTTAPASKLKITIIRRDP